MIFKLRYAECAQESRSVLGYARVCAGMCGCVRRVCADVHICAGVRGCVGVCTSMHWCVQKCLGVCECVCGMNFQNTYWRIESLHQRTLIHILYEFFILKGLPQIAFFLILERVPLSWFPRTWLSDLFLPSRRSR